MVHEGHFLRPQRSPKSHEPSSGWQRQRRGKRGLGIFLLRMHGNLIHSIRTPWISRTLPMSWVLIYHVTPQSSGSLRFTPKFNLPCICLLCSPKQALSAGFRRHCLSRCSAWSAVLARWPSSGVHLLSLPRLVRVGVGLSAERPLVAALRAQVKETVSLAHLVLNLVPQQGKSQI